MKRAERGDPGTGAQRAGHPRSVFPHRSGQVRVAAVVDALPERREKAEKLFGCDTCANYTGSSGGMTSTWW